MSWDPQIQSITQAGFSASIYAAESGAVYTTDSMHMTPEEVNNACKAVQQGAAGAAKVKVGSRGPFMVLRNDEDMCYFKAKGQGGGCIGKTKTLLIAALYEEGQEAGQLNDLTGKVVARCS